MTTHLRGASGLACPSLQGKRGRLPFAARRGFSLIEMLCVMILLGVVTAIMALMLKEILHMERSQAEGFDRILRNNALADQFRADVAQAESAPPMWEQFKADAHTLILHMKNKGHVVYLWEEKTLLRRTFADQDLSERTLPVGGRVDVKFDRAGPSLNVVRLRLLALRDGGPLPGQTLEIAAALGGDWR